MPEVICPYCGRRTKCVRGTVVYPSRTELHDKWFWLCSPCWAYVGCHGRTKNALGVPADAVLRAARREVHSYLDAYWQYGRFPRSFVYQLLAKRMKIPESECHIAMFSLLECDVAMGIIRDGLLEVDDT